MARTIQEPLTEKELDHLREEFWLNLVGFVEDKREEQGLQRQVCYKEAKKIMNLIVKTMNYTVSDFYTNPDQYSDILGAEGDFFREILDEAGVWNELDII